MNKESSDKIRGSAALHQSHLDPEKLSSFNLFSFNLSKLEYYYSHNEKFQRLR